MLGTCPFLSKETKYIFITILQVRQNASSEIFLRKARLVVLEGKFNLKIKLTWVLDKHFDSKAWKQLQTTSCSSKNVTPNLSLVFTTRKIWHLFSFFLSYLGRKSLRLLFASALLKSELIFLFHTLQKNSFITSCNHFCSICLAMAISLYTESYLQRPLSLSSSQV